MADVVSAERANVVNEGVVKDAESQSKSTLRSSSTAVTGRASALGDGKTRHSLGNDPAGLRGSAKVARRDGIAPAPGSVAYSNGKASNETITDESGVGRPSAKSGKPSPTTAGIFKIGAVDAGAGAAVDELDDTPEFEGIGSAYDKSLSAKRIASRIRRARASKSAGAHEASASSAASKAKKAKKAAAAKEAVGKSQAAADFEARARRRLRPLRRAVQPAPPARPLRPRPSERRPQARRRPSPALSRAFSPS